MWLHSSTSIANGKASRSGWPLVGRDDVLNAVSTIIGWRGPGSLVLSGRPGVGRSRLAHEALQWARHRNPAGFATEWLVATRAAASIPFGAFARLLDGFDLEGSDRLTLFLSAVEALNQRAGGRRLVLAVDDAHLLDQAGAALLHQVAATGTAFVVATVRTGEPAPEPVMALGRDSLGARIELPPLPPADFERLLEAVLDGPVDGRTLHDLVASTRGSVSLLSELVAAGLESKALVKADGIWRWTGSPGSVPALVAVVESHLGGLTPGERALMELIADAEPLELGMLEGLDAAGALESVERKDLLEIVQDKQRMSVRLARPLQREAIRATTPPLRRRALRRCLASALRDTGRRRRSDLPRYAAWRLDGGEAVDTEELLAAARRAATCSDHRLAERLSRAAVSRGGGSEATTDVELAKLAVARAVNLYLAMGETVDADEALRRAEAMLCGAVGRGDVAADADADGELEVLFALRALIAGRPEEAVRAANGLLQGSGPDELARLYGLVVAARALAEAGRTGEALAAVSEGTGLASRWHDDLPQLTLSLLAASPMADRYAGNLVEAEAKATAGYRRTVLERNDAARTTWTLLLGRVALDQGQVRTAVRWFREGTALSRVVSPPGQLPRCLANLSIAASQAGDEDAAAAALAEAEDLTQEGNEPFDSDLLLARAWTAAVRGETSRATKLALESGDVAWERGQLNIAASAFHDAARCGGADEALRRMVHIVPAVDGRRVPAMLAHATALQAHDGPGLDAASAVFEDMGAALLAAEAATDAAVVHRRNGKLASSLVAGHRARTLQSLCEGARTPALQHIECDVLTRREREVAALAARGLSNRDIAGLLVVSLRTVENQLHRVYGKLGVAGRGELATALGGPQVTDARQCR